MKAFIFPYRAGSESCKALAQGLDLKRIAHTNSRFKGSKDKLVINWGASKVPEEVSRCIILNLPQAVKQASDKLLAFKRLNEGKRSTRRVYAAGGNHNLQVNHDIFQGVADDFIGVHKTARYGEVIIKEAAPSADGYARTPEFTTSHVEAQMWLNGGSTVVERHILNGNSGAGIVLVEPDGGVGISRAPLYVKYVPKKQEYRVHVCGGQAVDIQRKARRKDVEDDAINWKIRNHDNGFIFARNEGDVVPPDVIVQSVNAVNLLGLAFGAVDVIFNEKEQKAYVLEVNTAPGLSGTTLEGYLSRFKDYLNGDVALPEQNIPKEFIGAEEVADDLPPPIGFFDMKDAEHIKAKVFKAPAWAHPVQVQQEPDIF
jgi:hypothetical protein